MFRVMLESSGQHTYIDAIVVWFNLEDSSPLTILLQPALHSPRVSPHQPPASVMDSHYTYKQLSIRATLLFLFLLVYITFTIIVLYYRLPVSLYNSVTSSDLATGHGLIRITSHIMYWSHDYRLTHWA